MPITMLSPKDAQRAINEWTTAAETLLQEVQAWITEDKATEWQISFSSADVTEESLGNYSTRVMEITAAEGRLILEPVGLDVIGAKGRIDLYAWPSLYRVMLLRNSSEESWTIRTESGIDWPQPWGKTSFLTVTEQLMSAP
ncbi:MAG: hypothetical protein ACRYFS_12735 [Janthinobacterium lividum]